MKKIHLNRLVKIVSLMCLTPLCVNAYNPDSNDYLAASSLGSSSFSSSSSSSGLSNQPSGTTNPPPPDIFTNQKKPEQKPKNPISPKNERKDLLPVLPVTAQTYFTMPGIIGMRGGRWVGSDNLFNLSKYIQIIVEVVKPEGKTVNFSELKMKEEISKLFTDAGIIPQSNVVTGPPLPIFHVLILMTPYEKGYVAYYSCRLFEPVELKRMVLDSDITFQAITWEKQDLLIVPTEGNMQDLINSIKEMTTNFINRYKYFQGIQIQQQQIKNR